MTHEQEKKKPSSVVALARNHRAAFVGLFKIIKKIAVASALQRGGGGSFTVVLVGALYLRVGSLRAMVDVHGTINEDKVRVTRQQLLDGDQHDSCEEYRIGFLRPIIIHHVHRCLLW